MSLSSLIVQREVATMRQVEEALARQVIYGGDLVTNLLEVARIDEAVLTGLLAESMRLVAAPTGELPVAVERVRALVPPEMAAQRSVVPLGLEGERLVLAVTEPMPDELEEQLAFALGMTIEQRAAPTVRVKQAIARIYGVPLERRMQRLLARMSGEVPVAGGLMPPLLGVLPAVMEPPRGPSGPPPVRSTGRDFLGAPAVSAEPAGAQPALSVPPPTHVAGDSGDPELPPFPFMTERRTGLLQREVPPSVRAARRRRGPVTFEAGRHEAEEAADRDALLDLFFDFARQFFDYAAMFLVHGDIAEGRDAFGVGASREKVVGIGVPLDLPGLMAGARDTLAPAVTRAPADGLDAELLADLQRARDAEMAIVPLVVRTRAVAILVGDCGEQGVDRASVQQVVAFAEVVGKAFERIIVRRKLDGFIAGSKGTPTGRVDTPLVLADLAKKGSLRPSMLAPSLPRGSAPPPVANIASVRPIQGPPIPREEPPDSVPRARVSPDAGLQEAQAEVAEGRTSFFVTTVAHPSRSVLPLPLVTSEGPESDQEARVLFDELGWDSEEEDLPPPPPSAAIAVAAHRPPLGHSDPPDGLPSVMVDIDRELAAIVERLAEGVVDEQAEGELLRQGERAMRALMAHFPGPTTFERWRIAITSPPPRPSECGPILRLVTRERRVALPFILEKLDDPDTETRGWATHVLCELPYLETIAPLLLRLRDMDLSTRVSAAHALAAASRLFPEEVRSGVLSLSHSADPIDRAAAMRVMGELREPSLVPDLVRALADGDEAVVAAAHASLVMVTRQDFGLDARPWLRWWEVSSSRSRIEWLIDALTHEVSEIRRAAGEELRAASKEYFGYASDLPQRDRERAQQRYRDWWLTEGRARFRRKKG